ncbi:hypothetical protein NIES2098_54110 [Calothrix sp. NIES-2098]|nr:hypothetical protein NIES2098_54110 [Calothrix sp. NIES-2098]
MPWVALDNAGFSHVNYGYFAAQFPMVSLYLIVVNKRKNTTLNLLAFGYWLLLPFWN